MPFGMDQKNFTCLTFIASIWFSIKCMMLKYNYVVYMAQTLQGIKKKNVSERVYIV